MKNSVSSVSRIIVLGLALAFGAVGFKLLADLPSSSTLSGYVYVDANNNGVFDVGEIPISGVTVTLTGVDEFSLPVFDVKTTDASGYYIFTDVPPGTHKITETQPPGYLDGKDAIGSQGGVTGNDVLSQIVLVPDQDGFGLNGINNNFGELLASSLSGFAYYDANNDGSRAGDSGIGGVTVTLTGTDDLGNAVSLSTTTDSTPGPTLGAYGFGGLRPGTYTITETQPAGYLDGKDTIGTPGGVTGNDVFSAIGLASGVSGVENNFGEVKPASLAGYVYYDANNDGSRAGDSGIGGVTVTLTGTDDLGNAVSLGTTTDSTPGPTLGAYGFGGLRPGTYTITETQPAGYLDGKDTIGTPGGVTGNDVFSAIALASGVNGVENNFGEVKPASLAGYVYYDANDDGNRVGDSGIGGVTVTLDGTDDLGNVVSLSTTTDSTPGPTLGAYGFAGLRPGTYQITETQPVGYLDGKDTIGTPGGVTANDVFSAIALASGVNGVENNFGELRPASLAGYVYEDANDDGSRAGESGIGGATVTLDGTDDLGNVVSLVTTTDSTPGPTLGAYFFGGLRPGTYTITETQPVGYLDGKDTGGTPGGVTGNDVFSAILLDAGVNGTENNFGELKPGTLAGFVYYDANNDGSRAGESGISGVTVTLTGTDDLGAAVNLSTTTSGSGAYAFTDLRPGTYTITETQPGGYLDGKDTIGTPGGVTGNDVFSVITLTEGVSGSENNFGELLASSLAGYVYHDANNDGSRSGDSGISGATVTLTGTDDLGASVNASTATGASGEYAFHGLRPGTYQITETQPAGYLDGKDTIGTPGGATANDVFSAIALAAGVDGTENNFGELRPGSLSGFVYVDSNNDGHVTLGEAALAGVTLTLSGSDDLGAIATQTTTTLADGSYAFGNLRPGTYTVTETQPGTYLDGQDAKNDIVIAGSAGGPDSVSGIGVTQGTDAGNNNFGELAPAMISGFNYLDDNNNGVKDGGEAGIPGTTMTLTGTDDLGAIVPQTTTTANDGSYSFANLRPGTYTVTESQNLSFSYLQGQNTAGTINSTPVGTAGGVGSDDISQIVLASGNEGINYNFGEVQPGSISGFNYADLSNDGIKDAGEPGLIGTLITLTGTDDLGQAVSLTTHTDTTGAYSFTNLRPGTYAVAETQNPDYNYLQGKNTAGTIGLNTVGSAGAVGSDSISQIVLGSGEAGLNYNFGELPPAAISGFVYADLNNNGLKEAGEAAIAGVSITLTGVDDFGSPVSLSTTTAGDGSYSFTNLRPGTYTVSETQPAGYLDGLDAKSNVVIVGSGNGADAVAGIALNPGDNAVNNNFGELTPGSLSGFVYVDANNDGHFGVGEVPISGVTLTLSGTDDLGAIVPLIATTAPDGSYSFGNLRPGSYTVTEGQPGTYLDGQDAKNDVVISGSATTDVVAAISVTQGNNSPNNNFGELVPGSLSGFVYVDANNNGHLDGGETPISGVTLTLSGTDDLGSVSDTTTTAGDGSYSFANLRPGSYTVTENQPAGYFDGLDARNDVVISGSAVTDVVAGIGVTQGNNSPNNNFGELLPASISGFNYVDANDNGLKEAGEAGIPGTEITLTGTDDLGQAVSLSTTTDGAGAYSFTNLRPGTYSVAETQNPNFNYLQGKNTAGTIGGNPVGTAGAVGDDTITQILLASGDAGINYNFGELPVPAGGGCTLTIGYYKNHPAAIQPLPIYLGTPGGPKTLVVSSQQIGVDVESQHVYGSPSDGITKLYAQLLAAKLSILHNADGTVVALAIAQADAFLATHDYQDWTALSAAEQQAVLGWHSALDNYNNGFAGPGHCDSIEVPPVQLSGFVFVDGNHDCTKQSGELGISGVTITLLDGNGNILATTTTSSRGAYSFTMDAGGNALLPGAYTIVESPAAGYFHQGQSAGSTGGTTADHQITTTVPNAGNSVNNNFCEVAPASISGFNYVDANHNGVKDAGEAGISGTTITLTGTDDLGQAVSLTTTTDNNGAYSFTNLRPGTYSVTETQNPQYLQGINAVGKVNGNPDGALGPGADQMSQIVLVSGNAGTNYNFGEWVPTPPPLTLACEGGSGQVNLPFTGVLVVSGGVPPYSFALASGSLPPGVTLNPVTGAISGTPTGAGTFVFSVQVTDAAGATAISACNQGCSASASWNFSTPAGPLGSSQTYTANGITLTAYGYANNGQPVALYGKNLGGNESGLGISSEKDHEIPTTSFVQLDLTQLILSGAQNATMLINSVQATEGYNLYGSDTRGVLGTLLLGNGTLDNTAFPIPGYPANRFISVRASAANVLLGAVGFTSGGPCTITITPAPTGTLGDLVWYDRNADGIQDAGEPALQGVTVVLQDCSGHSLQTTTTDGTGHYLFTGLLAGNYMVKFILPSGYAFSPTNQGSNPQLDNNADPATGLTPCIALASGVNDRSWDAGMYAVCLPSVSSIRSSFNGTAVAAGRYIWFNSVVKVSGVGSGGATIYFSESTIEFTAGGQSYSLAVPPAFIIFSTQVNAAITEFDPATQAWITTVPANYTGNVFLSGLAYKVPASLSGGINPVTWKGQFSSDAAGLRVQWQWAAAVYTTFSPNSSGLGVKPIDGSALNPYANSDHAGTPEAYKKYVVGGCRGGGGSDYTGSYSGTAAANLCTGDEPLSAIGNFVWIDSNANGIQDVGETGLANVTVRLLDCSGHVLATTTTDVNGQYNFIDLPAGDYSAQFVLPSGYLFTSANLGSSDLADSDANAGTGVTPCVTVGQGEANMTLDAGMIQASNLAFATYTQGGWGSTPHGKNPGWLLQQNFGRIYGANGVSVGGARYLHFTSAAAICAFLPAGSTPSVLVRSYTNPTTTEAGVFAGQVLALELNVDFSNAGVTAPGLTDLKVQSGKLAGYTVGQVLDLANRVLGGNLSALPGNCSVSDLNNVVDRINNNFDGGAQNLGYLAP